MSNKLSTIVVSYLNIRYIIFLLILSPQEARLSTWEFTSCQEILAQLTVISSRVLQPEMATEKGGSLASDLAEMSLSDFLKNDVSAPPVHDDYHFLARPSVPFGYRERRFVLDWAKKCGSVNVIVVTTTILLLPSPPPTLLLLLLLH